MAGSIALSLTQRYDKTTHLPLDGGLLYFFQAGTTTPQSAYQDISLTIPWPNPITLDAGGNVPQLFFADGYIKFRLANADGVTQIAADFVLVLGPTSGAGAAPSVDATTLIQTGWIQPIYGSGNIVGFVRLNGRTIGSATSGATERANLDTQALFQYLWSADPNLAVSTGRGASANADWVANKQLTLPDWRGRALAALDDMGNSAAGRLTTAGFGVAATALGAASTTTETNTIAKANLPNTTFAVTLPTLTIPMEGKTVAAVPQSFTDASFSTQGPAGGSVSSPLNVTNPGGATAASGGSGTPLANVPPMMLATFYVKL